MTHTYAENAELLNAFFSDLFTQEELVATPTFEQRGYREPLTDITIDDDMVAADLDRLIPNKSPGGDGRHPRLLVELKNEMATPLMMMFTHLLHEGQLPPSRKKANVTPIYKKGKRHLQGNYVPTSQLDIYGWDMCGTAFTRRHNDTHDRKRPRITETKRLRPGMIS